MRKITLLVPPLAALIVAWGLIPPLVNAVAMGEEDGFRAALGSCLGDPAYDPEWDFNNDGCINALDVKRKHPTRTNETSSRGGTANDAVGALNEVLLVEDEVTLVDPGQTVSVRFKLLNNVTPLFGYSLAIRAVPTATAVGSVSVSVAQTNFFPSRHLILADPGGAPLDPLFSIIQSWSGTGVFINANTADGSTVSAAFDVNDAFGEVFFTASPDASGVFEIQLGPATAMSDGDGASVPFIYCGGRIAVAQVLPPTADITGDAMVNVPDLLEVINQWGLCVPSTECPADLNCDAIVNVPDLLTVINGWSP